MQKTFYKIFFYIPQMQYAISIVSAITVSVLLTTTIIIPIGTYDEAQGAVVRDSQTQLLDGETVSAGGIHSPL
jgi:hypothetical protein